MMLQKLSSMKQLATLAITTGATAVSLAFCSQVALAQVVLVDDFESYTVGSSIDGQGAWEAQANTTERQDNNHTLVALQDGDNALQLINRDDHGAPNAIETVYASMALPSTITTGTVYMRWMKSSEGFDGAGSPVSPVRGDMILATNGLPTGFDPDGDGFLTDFGPGTEGQEAANYGSQAALVGLWATAGGTQFHARDNGSYKDVDTPFAGNVLHDQWYEMWMQIDHTANQQTRYYLAEDGGTPQVVMNGASEWWGHRNDSYSAATAIKFLHGVTAGSDATVYVDTVGLDLAGWSINSLSDGGAAPLAGDANNDGVVDLLDLDILGTNFGASPATFAQGDFNGDNTVDLLDLDILGTNFGNTTAVAVPEPATLLSICVGGLLCFTTRRRS